MSIEVQPEFRAAVEAVEQAIQLEFAERLEAAYVTGSIAVGEALPGASDFDCFLFTRDAAPGDAEWRNRIEAQLAKRFPAVSGFHLNVHPTKHLESEATWRFILRYNAVRFAGVDLLAQLENRGFITSKPSAAVACGRLAFARQCVDAACRGECPPSLGKMEANPLLWTRKLVRNFIVLEGAYLLMAHRLFESFHQDAVLRGLRRNYPQWSDLFALSERVLRDPFSAAVPPGEFLRAAEPFLRWMLRTIETCGDNPPHV